MGHDVRDLVGTNGSGLHLAKFEFGFFGFDLLEEESSLNIIENTEILTSLFDGNDVHDTGRETVVFSLFVVHLNLIFFVV